MKRLTEFLNANRIAAAAALVLLLIVIASALPGLVSGHSPIRLDIPARLAAPDSGHLLGTDAFGRDMLARIAHGGRYTLAVGLGVVTLAFVVGAPLGIISGYLGGWFDTVIMRSVDAVLSFPSLVLAIALAAVFGPSLHNAMLAVAITLAPRFTRVARSQALAIAVKPYVEAALAMGASTPRILVHYVFRNGVGPLLVQAALSVGSAILQTASLGFLGLGAQAPTPEWGADLAANLQYLDTAPWMVLAPGAAILLTVLSFNLISDALVDWLQPRQRRNR